jgi:hypothetical protein
MDLRIVQFKITPYNLYVHLVRRLMKSVRGLAPFWDISPFHLTRLGLVTHCCHTVSSCFLKPLLFVLMSTGWEHVTVLQPPTGLLFIPPVIYEHWEPWEVIGGRVGLRAGLNTEARGKIVCLYRRPNTDCPVCSQTLSYFSSLKLIKYIYRSYFTSFKILK